MIVVFTFSAAAYSRVARGLPGFIPLPLFATGCFTSLVFFFWLRVLDEHKDRAIDARYRPELPVPRGLVTLRELRFTGLVLLAVALGLNAWMNPLLLWPCLAVALWAALMTKEFFVRDWLRRHVTWYLLSHMLIMPMIDFYTTGLDWIGHPLPTGVEMFLLVTFLNGMVIEVGRKLRAPADEREGVDTYTKAWGQRRAPLIWLALLALTALSAAAALSWVNGGPASYVVLVCMFLLAGSSAIRFRARWVEAASALWTIGMYLLLGSAPWLAFNY